MARDVGIILIGHGSRRPEANETLFQAAQELRLRFGMEEVEAAFFSLAKPDVPTVVKSLVARGCRHIFVQPYFLYRGSHAGVDIPRLLEDCERNHAGLHIKFLNPLGADPRLVDVVEENLLLHISGRSLKEALEPEAIEKSSMEYIEKRLSGCNIPRQHLPIVKRVIHSTADFDFARTLIFHPRAVESGVNAIRKGCNIIVDVNMVRAGITKSKASSLICAVHEQEVKDAALAEGMTRCAAAMEKLKPKMKGAIVAIGNAPTAVHKVIEMVSKAEAEPALIVGVPVGFVGAAEAKAALARMDYPHITNAGPRGGSPVAAAILNGLAIMARDRGSLDEAYLIS